MFKTEFVTLASLKVPSGSSSSTTLVPFITVRSAVPNVDANLTCSFFVCVSLHLFSQESSLPIGYQSFFFQNLSHGRVGFQASATSGKKKYICICISS